MKKGELLQHSQISKKRNSTSNTQVKTLQEKRIPRKQSNKRFGDNATSSEGKVNHVLI